MTNVFLVKLLTELKAIYHNEGCMNFDSGINALIQLLSSDPLRDSDDWTQACSIYRTMAGSKSGFSDVYVDGDTAQTRLAGNARLDYIRQALWDAFDRK